MDELFEYRDQRNRLATCRLRVFPRLGVVTVIATDVSHRYQCASVTNSVEHIAGAVRQRFGIDPHALVFIEHYDDRERMHARGLTDRDVPGRTNGKTFDLVEFLNGEPHWKRITKENAERLTGESLS